MRRCSPSEIEGLSAAELLAKIEADGWIVGRHIAQDPEVYGSPEGCGDIVCGELGADLALMGPGLPEKKTTPPVPWARPQD